MRFRRTFPKISSLFWEIGRKNGKHRVPNIGEIIYATARDFHVLFRNFHFSIEFRRNRMKKSFFAERQLLETIRGPLSIFRVGGIIDF